MHEIYFDNNATTHSLPEVRKAMGAFLQTESGNPSSAHSAGNRARGHLVSARDSLAVLLGVEPDSLTFTSGADAKKMWTLIQQTSETLIKGVGELASLDAIPQGQWLMRELLELAAHASPEPSDGISGVLELVNEDVSISLGWEAIHLIDSGVERFWTLLSLTASVEPSWRAAAFLKRVSRCYLFGFDAECVVMCRSVLDAEFEAQVPREYCEDKFGCRRGKYTLDEMIRVAEDREIVRPEIAATAHDIRDLGNKAVHNWPKSKKNAADVIRDTLQVLTALS